MIEKAIIRKWLMAFDNFENSYDKVFKNIRNNRGLTQETFAKRLGITGVHISNIENRRVRPSKALLRRLLEDV